MECSGALSRIVDHQGELFLASSGSCKPGVPLNFIFEAIDDNRPRSELRKRGVSQSDIRLCRAFAATHLPERPEFTRNNNPHSKVSVLIDENISNRLITPLSSIFRNVTHVYHMDMGGFTDEFLFNRHHYKIDEMDSKKYRKERGRKRIIISRDSDMRDLIVDRWRNRLRPLVNDSFSFDPTDINMSDTPVIFQCRGEKFSSADFANVYTDHATDIKKAAYSGEAAAYVISYGGVKPAQGATFEEIWEGLKKEKAILDIKDGLMTDEVRDHLGSLSKKKKRRFFADHSEFSRQDLVAA